MTKVSRERKEQCRENLRDLKPGDRIYCVQRHVARSGMCRHIDFYQIQNDTKSPSVQCISAWVADLLGYPRDKKGNSVIVRGCGMDMGFAVVYELSKTLFPDNAECDPGLNLKAVWM